MTWKYVGEKAADTDFVFQFLQNENGERFQVFFSRERWGFIFKRDSREIYFYVSRDTRRLPAEQCSVDPDNDPSLGPDCIVHVRRLDRRIPYEPDALELHAATLLKSALYHFTKIPGTALPSVERVQFGEDALKHLNDYHG